MTFVSPQINVDLPEFLMNLTYVTSFFCGCSLSNQKVIHNYFHIGIKFGSASHVLVTCRWGSPSFLLAEFCGCRLKNRAKVRLRQRSANVHPMRKKVISLKHVKLRVDT